MTKSNLPPSLEPLSEAGAQEMIASLLRRKAASDQAARAVRERQKGGRRPLSEEADAREQLALAKLMFDAGKFNKAEYLFYSLVQIERIHDKRWLAGAYDKDLEPISTAMAEIERAHGLDEDESFYLDSAPPDWLKLNRAYEAVLSSRLDDALVEFDLPDLLRLRSEDKEQFARLRETGRLAFFRDSGAEANILNLIEVYERETRCAATAGAHFAAMMTLACAAEARLVLHCIRRPGAALAAAQRLAGKVRPRNGDPLSWNTDQLVAVAHAGGWLHNLPDEQLVLALAAWLENLPERRPGQQVLSGRQPLLGEPEFESARGAYAALRHSLDLAANSTETSGTLQ